MTLQYYRTKLNQMVNVVRRNIHNKVTRQKEAERKRFLLLCFNLILIFYLFILFDVFLLKKSQYL